MIMAEKIQYQQFYFTNYGDEQRFAAASTGSRKIQDAMLLLSPRWFDMSSDTPSVSVLYNARLNAYVTALMRDVSGDQASRKNIWVHSVLPEAAGAASFKACLSWPAKYFNPEINLHAALVPVSLDEAEPAVGRAPENGFHPGRLEALMTRVFETLLSEDGVLRFRLPAQSSDLETCYAQAAQIMGFIGHMVPEQLKDQLNFAVGETRPSFGVKFLFKKDFGNTDCYDLLQPPESVTDPLKHGVMAQLTKLLTEDPAAFKKRVDDACADGSSDMDRFLLSCCFQSVLNDEMIMMPQQKIEEFLPRVEANEQSDPRWARLRCRMLTMLDLSGKTEEYLRAVLEKYIMAASGIQDRQCPEYKESFGNIKGLLDRYCSLSGTDRKIYLDWMEDNYYDYYTDYRQTDADSRQIEKASEAHLFDEPEIKAIETPEPMNDAKDADMDPAPGGWVPTAIAGAGAGFLAGCVFDLALSGAAGWPVRIIIAGAVCISGILVKVFTDKYR